MYQGTLISELYIWLSGGIGFFTYLAPQLKVFKLIHFNTQGELRPILLPLPLSFCNWKLCAMCSASISFLLLNESQTQESMIFMLALLSRTSPSS